MYFHGDMVSRLREIAFMHKKGVQKRLTAVGIFLAVLCTYVDAGADSPTGYIPALRARVTALRFFEGAATPAPRGQRIYHTRFEVSRLRYLYWELNLEHPAPGHSRPFVIEEYWYYGDRMLTRQSMRASVRADWTWSFWHHGFRLVVDGKRHIGWHRVDLYVEGAKVATHAFELYDAGCRGQLTFAEAEKVREYEHLADLYRRQGDHVNYQAARAKLLAAYNALGGMCHLNGNLEAAIEHYTRGLGIDPTADLVYRNRGRVRAELGDLQGALEDYDRAIRLDPQDDEYYDSRAMVRAWRGEHAAALRDVDEAIRLNSTRAEWYAHRGLIRAQLLDRQGALQDFQHAATRYEKKTKEYERMHAYMAAVTRQDDTPLTIPDDWGAVRSFRK
jgi:tetratricopeptide (TPR) repeat protein